MLAGTASFFVHKIYFYHPDMEFASSIQRMQRKLWGSVKFFLIRDEEDLHRVLEKDIDPDQLEEKFGGSRKNQVDYWPPKTLTNAA